MDKGLKMDNFVTALINLAVSAESQFLRSKMIIHLEPDLYERFTFSLKQSLIKELHSAFDSGKFTLNTPVGKMLIVKNVKIDEDL